MITHVVLFTPRPDLSDDDAAQLVTSFEKAVEGVLAVRRAQVGQRIKIGRPYEQMMRTDFSHAAILEFEDVDGLRAYIEHPAHRDVGAAIFQAAAEILVYDFEMGPVSAAVTRP